ncbi:MAG: amidohydrolase family protein, partial [Armatimonadetes bacterium]|nr:amidohydrolase family protein [Armatimonadota bacterium]
MRIAVKAANLIDGTGAPPVRDAAVVIGDGTIAAVGQARALQREVKETDEVIDLGERTLLPGLVDAHTHL